MITKKSITVCRMKKLNANLARVNFLAHYNCEFFDTSVHALTLTSLLWFLLSC